MLNEKQTDSMNWQSRLADLENLPGEASDKNAAWERLHNRMQEKPVRNKSVWYWAAACMLLLIAIPLLVKKKVTVTPANNFVHQKQLPAPVVPANKTDKDQLPVGAQLPVAKKENAAVVTKTRGLSKQNDKKNSNPIPVVTAFFPPEIKNETVAVQPVDTISTLVAAVATPPKKKLPVVHINEIGRQEQENAKFATQSPRHTFQVKFLNQENYSGITTPAGNTNQEPVKLTIPLKN